jgi:transcriptional regulator with PAS, ATPase and Fis domain
MEHYKAKVKRRFDGISPEAESLLLAHNWPGNVRERRNAIQPR